MNTTRVFCAQKVSLDISDLDRFGEVKHIFYRSIFPDEVDSVMANMFQTVRSILTRFEYDNNRDFIALVGDPMICSSIVGVLSAMHPEGPIRLLKFDKFYKQYYEGRLFPTGKPTIKPVFKGIVKDV